MKKLVIALLIIFLLIISPRIIWQFKGEQPLDILVVDKTVPNTEYREHKGLFWLFTNEKVIKPNNEFYDIGIDYYGYDPYEKKAMETIEFTNEKDLVYIADTYGVYSSDFDEELVGERSELIYGGISAAEWAEVIKSKGTNGTLIAEFNTFASPTQLHISKIISDDLGVVWSEWIGRYFPDLNGEEIPDWLIRNYEQQYNTSWDFEFGGLAFVHSSDRVVIIEDTSENDPLNVMFETNKLGKERFPKVKNSSYHYWFDIISGKNDADVLASFEVDIHEEGLKALQEANIPTIFPAVIQQPSKKTFYFAGDFSDYTKDHLAKWYRGDAIMRIFSNEEADFYWSSYVPLMREILNDIKAKR